MIDLHAHLAPGIDDGPEDLDGVVAMARAAVAAGTTVIAATPHVDNHFGLGPLQILTAIAKARRAIADAGVPLEVVPGAEIALERYAGLTDTELQSLKLGKGNWILLECPLSPDAGPLENVVFDLQVRGFGVLLAHPERSPAFIRHPERVGALVARGARTSITSGSLRGQFGREVQRVALKLLQDGVVHNIASDAHDAKRRPPDIATALAEAAEQLEGVDELGDWLASDVPRAIIDGTPVPPAPSVELRPRRKRLSRR